MTKTTKNKPAKSVDEYLDAFPEKVRSSIGKVRKAIKAAAPKAVEVIGYRIPMYKYNGDLVALSAFKDHSSFITMSYKVMKELKEELRPYDTSGTTIHFSLNKPLPSSLVKKIVKARIKENDAKSKSKKTI